MIACKNFSVLIIPFFTDGFGFSLDSSNLVRLSVVHWIVVGRGGRGRCFGDTDNACGATVRAACVV